jgi:hypothetical protein
VTPAEQQRMEPLGTLAFTQQQQQQTVPLEGSTPAGLGSTLLAHGVLRERVTSFGSHLLAHIFWLASFGSHLLAHIFWLTSFGSQLLASTGHIFCQAGQWVADDSIIAVLAAICSDEASFLTYGGQSYEVSLSHVTSHAACCRNAMADYL